MQKPTAGNIRVNDTDFVKDGKQVIANKDLQLARRKIGMIFQNFNLLNEISVVDNVSFALKHSGLKKKKLRKVIKIIEYGGFKDKANSYPAQLSGVSSKELLLPGL